MVIRKNAKPTETKQSTHARDVYELCGGLGEPILHHIYENFPRKYPNFLFWPKRSPSSRVQHGENKSPASQVLTS